MWKCFSIITLCYIYTSNSLSIPDGFKVQTLLPDKEYSCCKHEPYASNRNVPVIYCFTGLSKGVLRTWMSVSVELYLNPEYYDLYEGFNSNEVWAKFEAQRSYWTIDWMNRQRKHIELNPFNSTCLGIRTDKNYTLALQVSDVDFFLLGVFFLGILLFYYAPILSENTLFYYVTAVIIGMSASLLVLLYFVIKLLPLKKPVVIGVMASGAALASYLIQFFSDNIYWIVYNYQKYVLGYFSSSALVSFVLYYRFGPITDPRSKNLIKYGLQVIASSILYCSSYFTEAIQVILVIMLIITNVHNALWINPLKKLGRWLWRRCPVKPRRLLSEWEYQEQGIKETARSVSELREYCKSPEFNGEWQIILGLQDTNKFANFVKGGSHISKLEIAHHQESRRRLEFDLMTLTDDSDQSDEEH